MFDIGWVEMMVVVVVMIIVIGPKDLPVVLHTMGRWIARVRAMARNFQDSIEEIAEESGLDQIRDEVRSIRDFSIEDEIEKAIDPEGEMREGIAGDPAKALESGEEGAEGQGPEGQGPEGKGPEGKGPEGKVEDAPEPESGVPARGEKT
ncbi:MAG: Sec-independent protein translocase protein TatB [Alphaproteobacteria bacterium]|nr:Sec-independent protein translocase protein TatB [Alphaproteobacteria bacterium]